MAVTNKYLNAAGVKYLWDKITHLYVRKEEGKDLSSNDYTTEEKNKLAELENYELPAASENELGGIIVGAGLAVDSQGVVHTVYNPEMPVDWDIIEDTPTTLSGYGITDAATKTELEEVKTAIAGVYKYKGTVQTIEDLENIVNPQNGDIYDVEEDGANYAWNAAENRWDCLGSIINIEGISNDELDIIIGCASSEAALRQLFAQGGNIELGANVDITSSISVTKNTVLNLNNYTLSGNMNGYLFVADGAKLTFENGHINSGKRIASAENGGEIRIKNGSYTSGDVAFASLGSNSKVVVDGGTITGQEGCIGAFDGSEIIINNGDIISLDNAAIFTSSTIERGQNIIEINGGQITGNVDSSNYESCCLFIANNDTVEINGGTFISTDGCGILMRGGTVLINTCEVTANKNAQNSHSPGKIGNNTTLMSASAVIYHESADYPGKFGMSLTINNGVFVGADHAVEIISNEAEPNVYINGGSFTPTF